MHYLTIPQGGMVCLFEIFVAVIPIKKIYIQDIYRIYNNICEIHHENSWNCLSKTFILLYKIILVTILSNFIIISPLVEVPVFRSIHTQY